MHRGVRFATGVLLAAMLMISVTGCDATKKTTTGSVDPETGSSSVSSGLPAVQKLPVSMFTESSIEQFGWSAGAAELDGHIYYGVPQVSERGLGVFSRSLSAFGTVAKLYVTKAAVSAVISQEQTQTKGGKSSTGTISQPDVSTGVSDTQLPDESVIVVIGAGKGWVTSLEYVRTYTGDSQITKNWKLVSHNVVTGKAVTIATDAAPGGPAFVPQATQDGAQVVYDITDKAAFKGARHSRLLLTDLQTGKTRTVVDSTSQQFLLPTFQGGKILVSTAPMSGATTSDVRLVTLDLQGKETGTVASGAFIGSMSGNTVAWLDVTDHSKTHVRLYDMNTHATSTLYYGGQIGELLVNDKAVIFTDIDDKTGFLYDRRAAKLYRLNPDASDILNVFLASDRALFEIRRSKSTGDSVYSMGTFLFAKSAD